MGPISATTADLTNVVARLDDTLSQLQERWKERPQEKANFKDSLERNIETMSQYAPSQIAIFIAMKPQLDPYILDLVIAHQRTILLPVRLGLSFLK